MKQLYKYKRYTTGYLLTALLLVLLQYSAQGQTSIKVLQIFEDQEEMLSPELLGDNYLLYAHKQDSRPFQVIGVKYIEKQNTPLDLTALNDGYINDVIGVSEDRKTLYTYHKTSKRSH